MARRNALRVVIALAIAATIWTKANADAITFDQAMEFLRTACASGTSVSISTGVNGQLILSKKAPGGDVSIAIGKENNYGSNIKDSDIRKEENESIRKCMSPYVSKLIDFYFKQSEYDWRTDAKRFSEIYSGSAGHVGAGFIRENGTGQRGIDKDQEFNTVTINAKTISVHKIRYNGFKGNKEQDMDIVAEADIADLNEYAPLWTGSDDELHLDCVAGECVRYRGWSLGSPSPGVVKRYEYHNEAVMDHLEIPLLGDITPDLTLEIQKILARLISPTHDDTVVCKKTRCS